MNTKTKIILLSAAGLILLGVCFKVAFSTKEGTGMTVETVRLGTSTIRSTVTATGTVEPITEVTVGTQVSGKVSKIYVDYNSVVKKGQVLAEIDKTNLQTEYNTQLLAVQSSKVEFEYQKKNFARVKSLHDKSLVSETDYETAKYTFEKAESAYRQNASNLDKAKTNLSYATIYSPIDGVVLSRAVEEGQTVAASFSTPTMFIIARDLTKMQVVANVDEADIGNVQQNQRVSFTVDAYPDDVFEGTITQVRLNPTTTSNVVTYQVIVNAPNPELKLKPGLTANLTVFTLEKDGVASLPNKALSFKPDTASLRQNGFQVEIGTDRQNFAFDEKSVWVRNGNAICRKVVRVGQSDGIHTEILSGLNQQDSVITDAVASKAGTSTGGGESPFMPKRPGSERKTK